MKKVLITAALLATVASAQASTANYNIVTTWYEPETQPKNTIFTGSFTFDSATHSVTNLQGSLTESMTGEWPAQGTAPYYDQTLVPLTFQLFSSHDIALGGTLVATFAKNTTNTFMGNTWTPQDGIDNGGVFAGGPSMKNYAKSIQNSYAYVFIPDSLSTANGTTNPLVLTWNEKAELGSSGLSATAYADCAPGGMMGAVCMTATSAKYYDAIGTMSGVPLHQVITAQVAAVPEPETYAMLLAGLGLMGAVARRRRKIQ
jgi:hypothetical protein